MFSQTFSAVKAIFTFLENEKIWITTFFHFLQTKLQLLQTNINLIHTGLTNNISFAGNDMFSCLKFRSSVKENYLWVGIGKRRKSRNYRSALIRYLQKLRHIYSMYGWLDAWMGILVACRLLHSFSLEYLCVADVGSY